MLSKCINEPNKQFPEEEIKITVNIFKAFSILSH